MIKKYILGIALIFSITLIGCQQNVSQEQFIEAVKKDNLDEVQLLLDAGMDPNLKTYDREGSIPLLVAIEHNQYDIAQALLKAGADPNVKETQTGQTPLVQAIAKQNDQLVNLLLEHKADPNQRANDVTPLYVSLAPGADITAPTIPVIFELLLTSGADLKAKLPDGETLLIHASKYGHDQIVQTLLDQGLNVNDADTTGATALMRAAESGDEAVVDLLLQAGADPTMRDKEDQLARDYARKNNHVELAKKL